MARPQTLGVDQATGPKNEARGSPKKVKRDLQRAHPVDFDHNPYLQKSTQMLRTVHVLYMYSGRMSNFVLPRRTKKPCRSGIKWTDGSRGDDPGPRPGFGRDRPPRSQGVDKGGHKQPRRVADRSVAFCGAPLGSSCHLLRGKPALPFKVEINLQTAAGRRSKCSPNARE